MKTISKNILTKAPIALILILAIGVLTRVMTAVNTNCFNVKRVKEKENDKIQSFPETERH